MVITVPLRQQLNLRISDGRDAGGNYATSALQKGLQLISGPTALAEEAVGFGVPVLKNGLQAIFPGRVELSSHHAGSIHTITAVYTLNLEERVSKRGGAGLRNNLVYAAKNGLAALIRRVVLLRGPLTALSSGLRWAFGWETTYQPSLFCAPVKMVYSIDAQTSTVNVQVDATAVAGTGVTEVIVMNEQGAHYFDRYRDTSGIGLRGNKIGCWDEVVADKATFESTEHKVCFTLGRIAGARLFRGRELVGSRLAWSGFGYSFAPEMPALKYTLTIEKTP